MAIDLRAVFRVQDNGTSRLRRIMQQTDRLTRSTQQATRASDGYRNAQGRLSSVMGRVTSDSNRASSANRRFASSMNGLSSGASSAKRSLSGLQSSILGIAGAYLSIQGAKTLFNATVGQAAKLEQQEVVTRTMFQDDGKAAEYSKMTKQMALDSAVLNSGDMAYGSKAFVGLTKDLGQLEQIWKVTEKLQAFSGVDTAQASFSFKELLQGDYVSIVDAIGMDKKAMQKITKLGTVEQKIAAITAELDKMGVTDKTLEDMSKTTLGRWSAITEKVQSFFTAIGTAPNGKLNSFLADMQKKLDGINFTALADKIGGGLSKAFDNAAASITFVKNNLDELKGVLKFTKEVLIGLTFAFVSHKAILGAMAIYKTIATFITVYRTSLSLATAAQAAFNTALFANPIGLVVAGIAALIGITILLVRNFDAVKAMALSVWDAIGGGSGAIALVLGPIGFLINAAIDLAKNWNSTKSVWQNVWTSIQTSAATSVNSVIGLINSLIETINKVPGINIGTIGKVDWGNTPKSVASYQMPMQSTSGFVPGFYHGLDSVPYDGMVARLHRNEMVLPAQEANDYRKGGGSMSAPVINIAKMDVRKESDIEDIAYKLASLIEKDRLQRGY